VTFKELCVSAGIDNLDAELILAHLLKKPRTWLLAHDDEKLEPALEKRFGKLLARRKEGEPIAYITGEKEFFGRKFAVTPDVLIPRPSTEGLVELALKYLSKPAAMTAELDSGIAGITKVLHAGSWNTVVDIGTGSGCIAITLALEGRNERIIGVDISKKALMIADENARRHGVSDRIEFIQSDGIKFIAGFKESFVVISNPPYIPKRIRLPDTVIKFEPALSLYAGPEGLDILRPLAKASSRNPACKGIVLELREDQIPIIQGEWTMDNG